MGVNLMETVINITKLFRSSIVLYSLSDLKLPVPIKVRKLGYFIGLFCTWGFFWAWLFYPNYNGAKAIVILAVPFGLANLMSRPIWNGREFSDWAKVKYRYMTSDRYYCDFKPVKIHKDGSIEKGYVNQNILLNRRSDYEELFHLIDEERRAEQEYGE